MTFPTVCQLDDIVKHIENNEQIRVLDQPNGRKVVCYIFMDSKTFPTPESRECRGIAFDANGRIVSLASPDPGACQPRTERGLRL